MRIWPACFAATAALAAVAAIPVQAQTQLSAPPNKVDEAQIQQILPPAHNQTQVPAIQAPAQPQAQVPAQIPAQIPTKSAAAAKVGQLGGAAGTKPANVAAVHGTDRCDPAVGTPSEKADCEQMLQKEAENAPDASPPTVAAPVDTATDSSSLVNGILNGGTGTVVAIPGK